MKSTKLLLIISTIQLTVSSCNNPVNTNQFTLLSSTETGVDFNNQLFEDNDMNYFTYPYIYMGGGVSVGDINNDDLDDIFLSLIHI